MGDEIAIMVQPRALGQVSVAWAKAACKGSQEPGCQTPPGPNHQVQHDKGGDDEDGISKPSVGLEADNVQAAINQMIPRAMGSWRWADWA